MPMRIPDNLSIATLFPDAAILPSRPAEPFRDVDMEEKVSDCVHVSIASTCVVVRVVAVP
jgi:hypothetical protein